MKKYFDIFEDGIDAVHSNWGGSQTLTDNEVLLAVYSYENYSGNAFLLYQRDGVLYEVHDSHCSCYGLENWKPEETTWAALAMRDYSNYGSEVNGAFKALVTSALESGAE